MESTRAGISNASLKAKEMDWLQNFKDAPTLDFFSHFVKATSGQCCDEMIFPMPTETLALLKKRSVGSQFNSFVLVLAALKLILSKYTGTTDITIACPSLNLKELKSGDKFFIRTKINKEISVAQFIGNVKDNVIRSAAWADIDINTAMEKFALLGYGDIESQSPIAVTFDEGQFSNARSPLTFAFNFLNDGTLKLWNNQSRIPQQVIKQFATHYIQLLTSMLKNVKVAVSALDFLSQEEISATLNKSVCNKTLLLQGKESLMEMFEKNVLRHPKELAVEFENKMLTYEQLNEDANRIAHLLRNEYGVKSNENVAVLLPRSEYCVIALLAVMKSNGCYVPIDPEYPTSRINHIINQIKPKAILVVGDYGLDNSIEGFPIINLEELTINDTRGHNVGVYNALSDHSFIIFTSGSTGVPKGVVQTHQTVLNLINWDIEYSGIESGLRQLQYASYSFDAALHDVLFALCNSGSVFVLNEGCRLDFHQLEDYVLKKKIQVLSLPFAPLNNFFKSLMEKQLAGHSLRHIISTGEQLLIGEKLEHFLIEYPEIKLHNFYGPTETHVVTAHALTSSTIEKRPSIGKPIANTGAFILDSDRNVVPLYVAGEVYLSGANLAVGYLNNEELTREKFLEISLPDGKVERMYKTGDVAYWREDNTIVYLGRNDKQIKIRGQRVELLEVEKKLLQFPGIDGIALRVIKDADEMNFLVAYLTSNLSRNTSKLRAYLSEHLPEYMIPSFLVFIDKFPLTPNGKIDYKALPDYKQSVENFVEPTNDLEKTLYEMWLDVLGLTKLSIYDDFFAIGGHSLKAAQLLNAVHQKLDVQLTLRDIFQFPTIKALADIIPERPKTQFQDIKPIDTTGPFPTSFGQRRLWLLSQFESQKSAYVLPIAKWISGPLNVSVFCDSLRQVINRHESLRTKFVMADQELKQDVNDEVFNLIEVLDISHDLEREATIEQMVSRNALTPFNLESDFPIRAILCKTEQERHLFLLAIHHIVADAWSLGVLMRDFIQFYNFGLKGMQPPLPSLKIQYRDYAVWQKNLLNEEIISAHRNYWLNTLAAPLPVHSFPTDFPVGKTTTFAADEVTIALPESICQALRDITINHDVSTFMALTAIIKLLMHRYSGENDIIIGFPVAGRDHAMLEDQIGFFVNTLPCRTQIDENETFESLIRKIRETVINGFAHQAYPYDLMVQDINRTRESQSPLFNFTLLLDNTESLNSESLHNLSIESYLSGPRTSKFDLIFSFREIGDGVVMSVEYNCDLFKRPTIERLIKHFQNLVKHASKASTLPISQLSMLTPDESNQINIFSKGPTLEINREMLWPSAFLNMARLYPDNLALVVEGEHLTYRELLTASLKLATYLKECQIQPNDVVALQTVRSKWMVIGVLGIVFAGGTYLPIAPTEAIERVKFILKDSGAKLLLNGPEVNPNPAIDLTIITIPINWTGDVNITDFFRPSDYVYLMYTSGTSGRPKGVKISHRSVANFIASMSDFLPLSMSDRMLAVSSYTFDISVLEIFMPLSKGAVVRILSDAEKNDLKRTQAAFNEFKPTFMQATPTFWTMLINSGWEGSDNELNILCGGELLTGQLATELLSKGLRVWNLYGPTETTIWSMINLLKTSEDSCTIGKPIHNTSIYILDNNGKEVPLGVLGEICIAGEGLAEGYHNRPEITVEKFKTDQYQRKYFRTGDIAKWLDDGTVQIIGRKDDQVKVRGYRIELQEIENVILQYRSIEAVKVFTIEDDQKVKILVAAYVATSPINITLLVEFLQKSLPNYMIPSYFSELEKMPLLNSGKTDKRALLSLFLESRNESPLTEVNKSPFEAEISQIWEAVLKTKIVSPTQSFFHMGGHSLKAIEVVLMIYEKMGVKVDLEVIFNYPTIRLLSDYISKLGRKNYVGIPLAEKQEFYDVSFEQERLWILSQFPESNISFNVPSVYTINGNLDISLLECAINMVIQKYEILRTIFCFKEDCVKQRIKDFNSVDFKMQLEDISEMTDWSAYVQNYVRSKVYAAFNLAEGPLIKYSLLKIKEGGYLLVIVQHHIISDQQSFDIFVREITNNYYQLKSGKKPEMNSLTLQYKDYAVWQRANMTQQNLQRHREHWLEKLKAPLPAFSLKPDDKLEEASVLDAKIQQFVIDSAIVKKLHELRRANECTLFTTLVACTNVVLYMYSHNTDIVIGTTFSERNHPDLRDQIGMFINTLALRTKFEFDDSLLDLLHNVRGVLLDAYEHHAYPFHQLISDLKLQRNREHTPLFNVMVQSFIAEEIDNKNLHSDVTVEKYREPLTSKFDLTINFVETPNDIRIFLRYNPSSFNDASISMIGKRLIMAATAFVEDSSQKISDVDLIGEISFPPLFARTFKIS